MAALGGVSLTVPAGGAVAVAGESGSGKSTLVACVLGLLDRRRARVEGRVEVFGTDVLRASDRELAALRGRRVGYVGQLFHAAFDPLFTVGSQLAEAHRAHAPAAATDGAVAEALRLAGLDAGPDLLRLRPHEMSGGMLQRAQVAAAILHRPDLLVLDEPTAALDALRRREFATLVAELRARTGAAVLLATHDLGLAARLADRVVVLHRGRVAAAGTAAEVLGSPPDGQARALVEAWRRTAGGGGEAPGGAA
ncbi:MAG: ABC transporter ATP-binding protein [Deltaproteobacteria bacterium]|nr:ABC transporter ATP-binding protein [Deltaproteobacteria bacterium]